MIMTSSTHIEPFEAQSINSTSFAARLGHGLGKLFLATKNKAKSKYQQVTLGINQSLEEEEARRFFEVQMALDAQAEDYEQLLVEQRKHWIKKTVLFCFLTLILGSAATICVLYNYVIF